MNFSRVLEGTKNQKRVWDEFRAVFSFIELKSFDDWPIQLAKGHPISGA
jgi:hypothetical protein